MVRVCRCCLTADGVMVVHDASYQELYQQLTNVLFQDDSGKPTSLCYECRHLFRKFMQLRDKCWRADRILSSMITNGVKISQESICKIARNDNLLSSRCTIKSLYSFELGTNCERDIKIANCDNEVCENNTNYGVIFANCDNQSASNIDIDNNRHINENVKIEIEIDEYNNEIDIDEYNNEIDDVKVEIECHDEDIYFGYAKEETQETNADNLNNGTASESIKLINEEKVKNSAKINDDELILRRRKQNADRARAYRKRIKDLETSVDGINAGAVRSRSTRPVASKVLADVGTSKLSAKNIQTHTGEKPFVCDYCERRFARKCSLVRHMTTHVRMRRFICDICRFNCSYKSIMVVHSRIHIVERKCNLCDGKCTCKIKLNGLIKTYTRKKPYKCDFCNFVCVQRSNLDAHKDTHKLCAN